MCKFKSALVLYDGTIIHHKWIDSHEDLITLYNIKDNGSGRFVRVEYKPRLNPYDLDGYYLHVDERETPEWFEQYREMVIDKLKRIIKQMIITEDTPMIIGSRVILAPGVVVKIMRFCEVIYMENSKVVEMQENSQVGEMLDSQVESMFDNSQVVEMFGSSQVGEMWDNSQVGEMRDNSQVGKMRDNSQVGEMLDNSQVGRVFGNSQVGRMYGNSQVGEMWDNSQVGEMRGNSQVGEMFGSSKIIKNHTKN